MAIAKHGPGMIGLPCSEIARYSDFLPALVGLQKPPGTLFIKQAGLGVANPLNLIALAFLNNPKMEWLLLLNDDNLPPPDTIPRLLSHDVDVVTGLYFGRIQPFEPILFDNVEIKNGRRWYNRHLMQQGEKGLIRAAACGDGCLLIRREVIEALDMPIWEYGETVSDACDHDVVFSRKVIAAGYQIWCDLDLVVDHIASFAVRPHRTETGEWQVHLCQGEDRKIALPAAFKGMNEK